MYKVRQIFKRSIVLMKTRIWTLPHKTMGISTRNIVESNEPFERKSSQRSEKSHKNLLYEQCPKINVNIPLYLKIQTYPVHWLSWDFISMLTLWYKWLQKHGNHCSYPYIQRSIVSYFRAIMPTVSNYKRARVESLYWQNLHPVEMLKLLKEEDLRVSFATVTSIIKKAVPLWLNKNCVHLNAYILTILQLLYSYMYSCCKMSRWFDKQIT